jgi:dihydrofolate reductase
MTTFHEERRFTIRKVTYYVACSVDGFIAHEDGSVDAFYGRDAGFDFEATLAAYDVLLMGRKTYDLSRRLGDSTDPNKENYVFSSTLQESPDKNVEIISTDPAQFVRNLNAKNGKDIWLVGGAELATLLFKENLIDDIILKVNPVLFGVGISLFSSAIKETELELVDSKVYRNSFLVLHYRVKQ